MDMEDQLGLSHLLLNERKCRCCGEFKNLIDGFYRTRKDRGSGASSYSYECKECCKKRVKKTSDHWEYPDWQFTAEFPTQNTRNNKYFQIN